MPPPPSPAVPEARVLSRLGQGAAVLIAACCLALTAQSLYDIAYLCHSPNDWGDPAETDLFYVWVVNVPGWLVALCLMIFLGPRRWGFFAALGVIAMAEIVLLRHEPEAFGLNKERRQRRVAELVRQMERDAPIPTPTPAQATGPSPATGDH